MKPNLQETIARLAALGGKVTEGTLHSDGRYFEEHHGDLTQCYHGDTGNYRNRYDGEAVALLWNLWKAGPFDATARPEYDIRVRIGHALDSLFFEDATPEMVDHVLGVLAGYNLKIVSTLSWIEMDFDPERYEHHAAEIAKRLDGTTTSSKGAGE
ncbi:hypothetical protein AKG11_28265 [Shinella sp. SUS2]|uniref:hypothetical protein n=1 Tax=unclassified Shinella TaxID=2643062 RepID=UPI00067F914C|nr:MULTISPECIES: hypothetical protein [unclassified Shinella]KNY13631.1 hypothetical protein AKG11_28265 [Shinella sp. SUS2]KOC72524.1 hypothetical protein AKG10_27130 [Shinella sp. GWS1]